MSAEPTTIAVIGGGLAALILVQQLREQLADSTHAVQLLVIDPAAPDQFGRGRAYATPWQRERPELVGSHAELLNSPASRMSIAGIIGPKGDFVGWLQRHQTDWQQRLGLVSLGGQLHQAADQQCQLWEQRALTQWLRFNQHALVTGQYETVYFPRCVYGDFLAGLAVDALAAPANERLTLCYIQADVQRLQATNATAGRHTLTLVDKGQHPVSQQCEYLVYAGGDLPPQPLGQGLKRDAMVLHNLYGQPRHCYHQQLLEVLSHGSPDPLQLLIVGGNASALDCLWGLANERELRAAMQRGSLQIKQLAPTAMPHSGAVLQPLPSDQSPDSLRWITPEEQQLLQGLLAKFLDPEKDFTAASYFAAVCHALEQLEACASPHLFMLFLRHVGAVEQQIRDRLPDIERFAADYHGRLEARLKFTPYEYWHSVRLLGKSPSSLERIDDKVIELREEQGRFAAQLEDGGVLHCDAVVNCTGARNPFTTTGTTLLDQLVVSGLGVNNGTGGFYLANDGRLKLVDGTFSTSVYLITQRSIGLHQSEDGTASRFVSANRLSAVRVAELAGDIALSLTTRISSR